MISGFHAGVTQRDLEYALAPLKGLEKGVRNRVVARVARNAGKEQLAVLKLVMPKNLGIARRAAGQKVQRYGGTAVSISGQKRGKQYKKTRYRPHSGLAGQGYPVPMWLIDGKVRPHWIPGRINRFGFQTRGTKVGKGLRNKKPMVLPGGFAWRVKHPGMPNRNLMGKVHLQSLKRALRMAIATAKAEVELEAQKARTLARAAEWD